MRIKNRIRISVAFKRKSVDPHGKHPPFQGFPDPQDPVQMKSKIVSVDEIADQQRRAGEKHRGKYKQHLDSLCRPSPEPSHPRCHQKQNQERHIVSGIRPVILA